MFLGKVIGNADSEASPEVLSAGLKIVQKLDLYRNPSGQSSIAVNYIGASDGDIVIVGSPQSGRDTSQNPLINSEKDSTILGILSRQESAQ